MTTSLPFDMSEREVELGYPSPTRNQHDGPISFSLPSLSQMVSPQPNSHSLPSKLDGLRLSKAKSVSPNSAPIEINDERLPTTKANEGPSDLSPDIPLSSSIPTSPVPESMPCSAPPALMPSPQPPAFKTWVPDGSLRFINPDFLSSAEKQTLEQQVQVQVKATSAVKRKECEETPSNKEDEGKETVDREKVDSNGTENEERPKKMGRPLPLNQDEDLSGPPPLANISSPRMRPSTLPSSLQRRHSRPSHVPLPTQSNEMDLLRQVSSNNLNIPTPTFTPSTSTQITFGPISDRYMNWIPSGNYPQDRVQYNHIHNQHQHRQHQHHHQPQQRTQPPQNKQNDLFTYKPLYLPPPTSSYIYRPEQTPPNLSQTPSSSTTAVHPRALPAPSPSACSPDSPPLTELPSGGAGPLAMNLPRGDWRRRYVGRGRGQSGG